MRAQPDLPGVIFTMRYPDDTGYVWNHIAYLRDEVSAHLAGKARPCMAFPRLSGKPSYALRHMPAVELDCYDNSPQGRAAIEIFVRRHHVKVIVFMSAMPETVCLDLLCRLGVRTLNTENDSFDLTRRDGLLKRSAKFLMRRVLGRQMHDLHLANSRGQQQFLLNYAMLPARRVVLMTNCINTARFSPGDRAAARVQTGLAPERFWILAVSQARAEKRVEQLIRVIHQVRQARPERAIGFVYVGDGELVAGWKALVAELGLQDVVVFAGRQDNVLPWYQGADLMVHGAERESFGLAVVEAMSCAVPVVASAAMGPAETILDGATGAVIPLHDFDAFLQAVLRYVDDSALAKKHGVNARAHVDKEYNVVHYSKEFAHQIVRFL
jgi:glycosyltransferase involved in cell wall biosynthesis